MSTEPDTEALAAAMRAHLDDVHPDLDRLVTVATKQGTRIKRVRRAALTLGAAASVAVIGLVGTALASSTPGHHAPAAGGSTGSVTVTAPPLSQPSCPGLRAMDAPSSCPSDATTPPPEKAPVTLDLPGWKCGPAADEKMICTSGNDNVGILWRPASEHAAWTSDPDKTAAYVGPVHHGVFVTATPVGTTTAQLAVHVAKALTWVN